MSMKHISIIIPCHNEEKGIGKVIAGIPVKELTDRGYTYEVLVIDNNSTDATAEIAREAGATVLFEGKKGKGNAVLAGFSALSTNVDFVVMVDGDDTYKLSEMLRMIEPLESGFCDVVVGSRLTGKTHEGALVFKNRLANWVYTFLVRQLYRGNVTDVLSGYFAWKKEVVDTIYPYVHADGFALEMEMVTKMVKLGFEMYSVPITYDKRAGETKLNSFVDGAKILAKFSKNLLWKPKPDTAAV